MLALAACGLPTQRHESLQEDVLSLKKGDLEASGLAFLTPSTVTGQEEDRQALALVFSHAVQRQRPQLKCLTLPQTLGAINRAGLADEYRQMYDEYRVSGIFRRTSLQRIGKATGVRYFAQLKLADFRQRSDQRFGALGFRVIQTQQASIRLFVQIWDVQDGSIAWEASREFTYADETFSEQAVTFKTVVEEAAKGLIAKLP